MVKHTQTILRQFADVCLSVFDHIVKLALKELGFCLEWYSFKTVNMSL